MSPPYETRRCVGFVAHRLERLRYCRTPFGNAVINDMSWPEGGLISDIDIGDFVIVTIRETEPHFHWRKNNPFRVVSFLKTAPPEGVDRVEKGDNVRLVCNVIYWGKNAHGLPTYRSTFASSIQDVYHRIENPEPEPVEYKVCIRLLALVNQPGKELIISALINTIRPKPSERGFLGATSPAELSEELEKVALSTSLPLDDSFDQPLEDSKPISLGVYPSEQQQKNNVEQSQWAIHFDNEDLLASRPIVKTKEEKGREILMQIWNNTKIRRVIHKSKPEISELINQHFPAF
ncbi:unnamed protein product, partial [Mesorhabditis belari]|uniref:Uncharacterized protein n=1 Tax=Mesorhabditis belari TaxID=2138241 RepID=A0AAF3FC44_9BILA